MVRYFVEARRMRKGATLWSEAAYRVADRPKQAAIAAGMPASARRDSRLDNMGGIYQETASKDGDYTRWYVSFAGQNTCCR